jgi:hypothetical protein
MAGHHSHVSQGNDERRSPAQGRDGLAARSAEDGRSVNVKAQLPVHFNPAQRFDVSAARGKWSLPR